MADIKKLRGITSCEAEALRTKCHIKTVEDLWLRIGDADNNTWQLLTDNSGIEKKRLIDLLAAEGMSQRRFARGWFNRHWFDLLVFLVALALGILIWRRV